MIKFGRQCTVFHDHVLSSADSFSLQITQFMWNNHQIQWQGIGYHQHGLTSTTTVCQNSNRNLKQLWKFHHYRNFLELQRYSQQLSAPFKNRVTLGQTSSLAHYSKRKAEQQQNYYCQTAIPQRQRVCVELERHYWSTFHISSAVVKLESEAAKHTDTQTRSIVIVVQCAAGSLKISRRNPCSPFFSVSYSINRHKIL